MKTEDESLLKGVLGVLLRGEVVTLGEYLEREGRVGGDGEEDGLPKDSSGEQLRGLLGRTFVLEDPLIPSGLREGFLSLRKLRFCPSDNSLDVEGDKRRLSGVGMERLLGWSSLLAQSYSATSVGHCSCSGRRAGDAESGRTRAFLSEEGEPQDYGARDFELLLHRHFPRMKRPRGGGFELPQSKRRCGVCVTSRKFRSLCVWETLARIIGPVEMLFLLVCCIIFERLEEDSDTLFIQQTGRMLTNDFLEELGRFCLKEPKRVSPDVHSSCCSPLPMLSAAQKKGEHGAKPSVPIKSRSTATGAGKESRLSRIYSIDIPSHAGILYCDHFSRRGGLPCLSILRLLPPSLLGARTLLRFVIQTDHLFREHDRQSLIGLLGSYEMTRFSRVRCRLASSLLQEFQKLLLSVRSVSPVDFLGKVCPVKAIKDSDLENLNSLPILQFETDLSKVVNFLRLYLIKILPKNILGTFKNLKIFINRKVPIIANLHIRETFCIKHATNEMEVSAWVNRVLEQTHYENTQKSQNHPPSWAGSKKVPAAETRSRLRKSLINLARLYLAKNVYFLIAHVVIPILRRHFYATEIEGSNKVRYFRHPVWIKIVRQADKGYLDGILRGVRPQGLAKNEGSLSDQEVPSLVQENLDYLESIPKIRWLPKSKGLRPLLNLSKVGSGQILQRILERRHLCERSKRRGFCDCNSVWTGGELPTSWICHSGGPLHGAVQTGRSLSSPTSRVTRRPSSSRILDARRPSTNNMLLYPSKILRSFLLTDIGRKYLGASILRYGDVYKSIRRWWFSNWEDDALQPQPDSNWEEGSRNGGNVSHRRIYIIKADLMNCFENIDKTRILEFLDRMSFPEEIPLFSLYSRTLSKTSILPPFDNISRCSSWKDELGRTSIITSRGRLSTVPVFEREALLKPELAQSGLPDSEEPPPLLQLSESCTSRNAVGGILGRKVTHILAFLNSRRFVSWKLAKKLLGVHLNTNFVRLRTVSRSSRLARIRELEPSARRVGRRLQSLFRQGFGIPQGSSISYILCCLYYGFLDLNPQVQDLLGLSSPETPLAVKQESRSIKRSVPYGDLETDSATLSPSRYSYFKQNKTRGCNTTSCDDNKRRRVDESRHYNALGGLESCCCCTATTTNTSANYLLQANANHRSSLSPPPQQKNLLLRWVDDFLFLTSDPESARKFLELLYIHKLWGPNVSKDKINSNFRWTDLNQEIVILDDLKSPTYGKRPSKIRSPPVQPADSPNGIISASDGKDYQGEIPERRETAPKLLQKNEVLWSGIKFSSDSLWYLDCKISPWKNLEFVCVMDTITLTATSHNKFKTMALGGFQRSGYMWSVLGMRLVRYFDFRIRNGLLFDCKINSIRTIYANIVILTYIGTLKLLSTFKRIKKIHQGFVNPKFLVKVLEWISDACCCNIYSYKKQLANRNQWSLLIKCAVYDSIVTCLYPRHKALGVSNLFRSYKTKLHIYSSILKKDFDLHPQSSLSIIREHRLELPSVYRRPKKKDGAGLGTDLKQKEDFST